MPDRKLMRRFVTPAYLLLGLALVGSGGDRLTASFAVELPSQSASQITSQTVRQTVGQTVESQFRSIPGSPVRQTLRLRVAGTPQGASTRYIGATEGNTNFQIADLQDLGINTYRIYGGMSRWEFEDDDGVYGWPSIEQIKADPDLIQWHWWDQVMSDPPNGSDYHWSGSPDLVWQGNARTIFAALQQAQIRPVVTLRNIDDGGKPGWAQRLNPPRTEADRNEWWAHVFATVYWLNVRNDYRVDDFEIHNEPDYPQQGWGGTQADYLELLRVARDAIAHVYDTYLPDRRFTIHAPVSLSGSSWPLILLRTDPTLFEAVNIHNYEASIARYTQVVRRWMREAGVDTKPLWMSEWGSYGADYDRLPFALGLIENLIRGSQPGLDHIDGSHLFSLYDWGRYEEQQGLISQQRRLGYYAMRLGVRALQGGRPTFAVTSSQPGLLSIATQDCPEQGNSTHLLIVNRSQTAYRVEADLSALLQSAHGTLRQFNASTLDQVVDYPELDQGQTQFELPAATAIAIEFEEEE